MSISLSRPASPTVRAATPGATVLGGKVVTDPAAQTNRFEVHADGEHAWGLASTTVAATVASGVASVTVNAPIPSGAQVLLSAGTANEETATCSKTTGTRAPYTCVLTANTTKAHTAGDIVVAVLMIGSLDILMTHAYDNGVSPPVDHGFIPVLRTSLGFYADKGVVGRANGGFFASGDTGAEAYAVVGRNGEEITLGVAADAGDYFTDALPGDTVVRAFLSRLLGGTGNGLTNQASAFQADTSRSFGLNVPLEPKAARPAGATDPLITATPVAWVPVVVGGVYRAMPVMAYGGSPAAVPASAAIPGPGGARAANGGLTVFPSVSDRFPVMYDTAGRADSALSPGVSDSGHAWTALTGVWGVQSGRLYCVSADPGVYYAVADTGSADGIWRADVILSAGTPNPYLTCRMADAQNGLHFDINKATNRVNFYKLVAGAYTLVDYAEITLTAGAVYTFEILLSGATVELYLDGRRTNLLTHPQGPGIGESLANTRHGIGLARPNDDGGSRWDNITFTLP